MPDRIRIFLASPSDTAEAREAIAAAVRAVQHEPAYRNCVTLELVRWDDPDRPVPVSFLRNPQADVVDWVGDPRDCDLVVGLFRHVFGSPLPIEDGDRRYGCSPDGDPWTGTEWELHRARAEGSRVRDVWVFRDVTPWSADHKQSAAERDRRWKQWGLVLKFFDDCRKANGTITNGTRDYADPDGLKAKFLGILREWVDLKLNVAGPKARNGTPPGTSNLPAETLDADQQRLLDTLLHCDEPLDEALVTAVYRAPVRGLRGYLLQRVAAWCMAERQLDHRFVNLDLMVDRGAASTGERFEPKRYETLQQLLDDDRGRTRGWVLVGDPGSGKSTLLQHHELLAGRAALRALANGQPPARLCLWQRLADAPHDAPDPGEWLQQQWQRLYPALPPLSELRRSYRLQWLLDGLNEIQAPQAADWRAAVKRWAGWAAGLPADGCEAPIFSVRTLDYTATLSSPGLTVQQVRLGAWRTEQIEQYCTLRLGPGNALWPAIERDHGLLDLCALPFNLDAQCGLTMALGRPAADRAELFSAMAWQRLRRAHERQELDADALLTGRERAQLGDERYWLEHLLELPAGGSLIGGLDRQARAMHRASAGTEVSVDEGEVAAWLDGEARRTWLAAVQALNIAEVELSGRFRYTHQLWQEFHAGRGLCELPLRQPQALPDLSPPPLVPVDEVLAGLATQDPLPGPGVSAWEEPVKLAVQLAARRGDGVGALRWIEHLRGVNLALAGRAALGCRQLLDGTPLLEQLRAQLLARSRDAAVDLRRRIEAAEALGELGDPRYRAGRGPEGHRYLAPVTGRWIPIAAGRYVIGTDDGDADEQPPTDVDLPAFRIAFAPVTNAEYRCFIEAGGYEDERWWVGETALRWLREGIRNEEQIEWWREALGALRDDFDKGVRDFFRNATEAHIITLHEYAQWSAEEAQAATERWFSADPQRLPAYWDDPNFNRPLNPVVGVSLFEAQAYARWLAAQTAEPIDLPTEAQWEAAARGTEGRRWPWGRPDPDWNQINADPAHLRRTSPVGVFPAGDSPDTISDLAGNVWEWTACAYTARHDSDTLLKPAADGMARRVLRGGAWDDNSVGCRAAYRFWDEPDYRSYDVGFRLVVSCPIQTPVP